MNNKLVDFAEENERIRHQLHTRDLEAMRKSQQNQRVMNEADCELRRSCSPPPRTRGRQ